MDAAVLYLIKFTAEIMRKAIVSSINRENPSDWDGLKEQLRNDFESVISKLDNIMQAELKYSHSLVMDGLNAIEHKRSKEEIKQYFLTAEANAKIAFHKVDTLPLKIEATKLRIYSLLHIRGHFESEFNFDETMFMVSEITMACDALTNCSELKKLLNSGIFVTTMFGGRVRKDIITCTEFVDYVDIVLKGVRTKLDAILTLQTSP